MNPKNVELYQFMGKDSEPNTTVAIAHGAQTSTFILFSSHPC